LKPRKRTQKNNPNLFKTNLIAKKKKNPLKPRKKTQKNNPNLFKTIQKRKSINSLNKANFYKRNRLQMRKMLLNKSFQKKSPISLKINQKAKTNK